MKTEKNICVICNKPVGNTVFTVCDDCWDKEHSQQPASTEDKLIGYVDYMNKLLEYIALLDEELNETAIIAYNHGWRTTRKEEGEDARSELDKIAKSLLLPSFTAALQLIKEK